LLDSPKNRAELDQIVQDVFGEKRQLLLELSPPPEGDLKEAAASLTKEEIKKDRLSGRVYADPLVQTALEVFRGEVTDIAEHEDDADSQGGKP